MFKKKVLSLASVFFMSSSGAHAASADLGGWRVTFENMNCVVDGQALDVQNGDVFSVRVAYPSQRPEKLIFGLYTKKMAEINAGKQYDTSKVRFFLAINDNEFRDAEYMFDQRGTLVIAMPNTLGLQASLTENSTIRIVLLAQGQDRPISMALLQVKQTKAAFDWLNSCAIEGINSVRHLR
jgi:hypothetical protein